MDWGFGPTIGSKSMVLFAAIGARIRARFIINVPSIKYFLPLPGFQT